METEIELIISPSQVEALFREVTKARYKKEIDFTPITNELSKLKRGGSLKHENLEMISDRSIWPFYRWWSWPAKDQIEESLSNTDNFFIKLNDLPKVHEERYETEKDIIKELYYKIFKHIELVSIVLRFIDEDNFAIFSPPVAFLINSPRGDSYETEYLNYLGELRKWKDVYQLEKVAYVDMFLWAIEVLGDKREEIWELFHRNINEENRKKTIQQVIKAGVFNKNDKDKALFYLSIDEYDTAAKWAGCAFEGVLNKRCKEKGISLMKIIDGKIKPKTMREKVGDFPGLKKEEKERIVDLRNKAAHPSGYKFTSKDVKFMIKLTEKISN